MKKAAIQTRNGCIFHQCEVCHARENRLSPKVQVISLVSSITLYDGVSLYFHAGCVILHAACVTLHIACVVLGR